MASYNDIFDSDGSPSWLTASKECEDQCVDLHSPVTLFRSVFLHPTFESSLEREAFEKQCLTNGARSRVQSG